MIMTELEHSGFRNIVLITDRGYESMNNIESCIAKRQKLITSVKCGQGEALKMIKSIDLSTGVTQGMAFSKETGLRESFQSTESILEEMRTIRCIEHDNRRKFITPFVGGQVTICDAFVFEIPEGCRPTCISKKSNKGKRGRPAKLQTETLT